MRIGGTNRMPLASVCQQTSRVCGTRHPTRRTCPLGSRHRSVRHPLPRPADRQRRAPGSRARPGPLPPASLASRVNGSASGTWTSSPPLPALPPGTAASWACMRHPEHYEPATANLPFSAIRRAIRTAPSRRRHVRASPALAESSPFRTCAADPTPAGGRDAAAFSGSGVHRILPNPARSSRLSFRSQVTVPELLSPIPNPANLGFSCTPAQRGT